MVGAPWLVVASRYTIDVIERLCFVVVCCCLFCPQKSSVFKIFATSFQVEQVYKSLAGAANRLTRKIWTRNVKCSWPLVKAWTGTDLNTVVITKIKETHTDSLQNVDAIILLWKVLKRLFTIVQLRRKEEAEIKRSVGVSEDGPKLPKSRHKSNGSRASLKKKKLKLSSY